MGIPLIGQIVKGVGDTVGPLAKIIMGMRQKKMGENLKRSDGFDYINPEAKQNQSLAKQMAYSNRSFNQGVDEAALRKQSAGEQYRAQQTGSAAAKNSAISSASNRFMNRRLALAAQGRNERVQRVKTLMNANVAVGDIRQDNEQQFQDQKRSLKGASMNNIYGGIAGWGQAISNSASMFGKGKATTGSQYNAPTGMPAPGGEVDLGYRGPGYQGRTY